MLKTKLSRQYPKAFTGTVHPCIIRFKIYFLDHSVLSVFRILHFYAGKCYPVAKDKGNLNILWIKKLQSKVLVIVRLSLEQPYVFVQSYNNRYLNWFTATLFLSSFLWMTRCKPCSSYTYRFVFIKIIECKTYLMMRTRAAVK